jgi:hypothetical protein
MPSKALLFEDDHAIARQRRMYARLLFVVVGIFKPLWAFFRCIRHLFRELFLGMA